MYFSNSHARRDLPIPAIPVTETRCARRSSAAEWKHVLDLPQLAVAADERRLEARPLQRPLSSRDDAQRPPERHGLGLALELERAGVGVGDRSLGRAPGRLADEHGAGLGGRLDARGGVDEVAGDHALVGAHRGSPRPRR